MMYDQTHRPITVDGHFDKVFYINLQRAIARKDHIEDQLSRAGITNYERVEAEEFSELPHPMLYRNFIRSDRKYVLGSLGCRASHLKCVAMAQQRGYNKILILEDDVVFREDPNRLLTFNNEILGDWDILYFGGLIEHFFRNQVVGAFAYALNSSLFDNIIYMAEASGMEIDNFYAKILQHMSYNYNQSGKYNIRCIQPFNLVGVDMRFESSIR